MTHRIIRCIVVEDEPLAATLLKDYIEALPQLSLVAHCADAIAALEILKTYSVDLIFLDINLPKLKGIDFLRTLTASPQVIITSGYNEYALQGFELNVADYLLKPISFSRFSAAVHKVVNKIQRLRPAIIFPAPGLERRYLFFDLGDKRVKIFLDEIHYLESCREYVKLFCGTHSLLSRVKISDVEQDLPDSEFVRIHRSYIVNTTKVESYSHDEICLPNISLPMSRGYKSLVQVKLKPIGLPANPARPTASLAGAGVTAQPAGFFI